MSGFGDVYTRLSERHTSPQDRGRAFEFLVKKILTTDPTYRERFAKVWRWPEWPGRDGSDTGVDIVAERRDGGLVAIQCKCQDRIDKGNIDSFLADSQRQPGGAPYVERYIFTTATRWSGNAEQALTSIDPPVQRVDFSGLDGLSIDWDPYLADEDADLRALPRKQLRPHQESALNDVLDGFRGNDRGKLIMACGTGKTLTSLHIAESLVGKGGRVLFTAPSLSLLNQSMREWGNEAETPLRAYAVCSDVKVGRGQDGDSARVYDMPIPATTDGQRLAESASVETPDRMTVVFSTYQSMAVIADAQRMGFPEFDLVICDEAHRTTGALGPGDSSAFVLIHDNEQVKARKRLYMTATPRIYAERAQQRAQEQDIYLASMDKADQYGPEFHRLGFAQAVEANLLSDYKVTILVMSESQIAEDYQGLLAEGEKLADVGRVIGCLNGLAKIDPEGREFADDKEPMHRAVAFSNTIKASKRFVELVDLEQDDDAKAARNLAIQSEHVDGTSGVIERDRLISWLRGDMTMTQRCHVLSNARCLTEGIDVPALDAILFLQPRKSQIDVVQAVGRVMRKAEGKRYGYIILPVVVPSDEDPANALDRNDAYSHVWQVLQALRAHDERFDAYVNKLDLNKNKEGPISVIGVGGKGDQNGNNHVRDDAADYVRQGLLGFDLEELRTSIIAQIVKRCGERHYWETWAESVTDIARHHRERIRALIESDDQQVGSRFQEFVAALRGSLNNSITNDAAADMLSQHLITRPVFDALFGSQEFTQNNPVSQVMQGMIESLEGFGLEAETAELAGFYDSVRRRVEGIDNVEGKQRVVVELYERFFKSAYPKVAESLGIVYTPVDIVDFIIRSVQELLGREFGASLSDEGVHILDPFVGTGTFITRLLQSGHISKEALLHKYGKELHANEIMLLAYYIAAVNIETTYAEIMGEYQPFEGIVLTDTFQASEMTARPGTNLFPRNSERIEAQLDLDIRVIIGNPPWSRAQGSQNDNNPNQTYPSLDGSIAQTYASTSTATLLNALYDSYVRAIRWASDRVQAGDGGIVAFVTNSGFLDGKSADGLRKALAKEFHAIYVYDLRGKARTSGETRRLEGGGVFSQGSRAGAAILLLVKRPELVPEEGAVIHYHDIGDSLSRERKLEIVSAANLGQMEWTRITPNEHGDWINQRSSDFRKMRPLIRQDSDGIDREIFAVSSYGVNSGRDPWAYNSSLPKLRGSIGHAIEFFNKEVARIGGSDDALEHVNRDSTRFSWDRKTEQRLVRGGQLTEDETGYRDAVYRPFFRQRMYVNVELNARTGVQLDVYPIQKSNFGLFISSVGGATLAVDAVQDLHMITPDGRFLPRYTYDKPLAALESQPVADNLTQRDNITDEALNVYRARYGEWVTKDHIFSYVYGVLHSPEYRQRYAADLARLLPRIPEVESAEAFRAFSEAGQQLLDLHIGYEEADLYPLEERLTSGVPSEPERYRVQKMRWGGTTKAPDRSLIVYNDWITLAGIPDEAHEYIVGPRSALAWLIDRYRVTTDKASGIVNDPNDWGLEQDNPRYIIDLVKRITTVSVETVKIVRGLPPLDSRATLAEDRAPTRDLGTAIHELFRPLGGVDLSLPPREPMREPPQLGD